MTILANSLMIATRTETNALSHAAQPVPAQDRDWSLIRSVVKVLGFPFRLLKGYEAHSKFRSMDVSLLMDVGLTQADIDRASFRDFVNGPTKR